MKISFCLSAGPPPAKAIGAGTVTRPKAVYSHGLSWPYASALHGSCDGFARMIPMLVLLPSSLSIQFPSIHVLEKPFDPSWFLGDVTGESLEMV